MATSKILQVPTEVAQAWIQYLEPADLCAYRLTCRQAEFLSIDFFASEFFTIWKTSLMGADIEKLKQASNRAGLREHIKQLHIEDDCERNEKCKHYARDAGNLWPRNDAQMVVTSAIGVDRLRAMLKEGWLRPETILIRDIRRENEKAGVEAAAALARDVCDGADLAITAVSIVKKLRSSVEAHIHLSPEHQGQNMASELLHCADLPVMPNVTSYWLNQVLTRPSVLTHLSLTFDGRQSFYELDSLPFTGTFIQPRLERLALHNARVSIDTTLALVARSKDSLTDLSLKSVTICKGGTWRELLTRFGSDYPRLRSIHLCTLQERVRPKISRQILFLLSSCNDLAEEFRPGFEGWSGFEYTPDVGFHTSGERSMTLWSYNGENAGALLKVMASKMALQSWGRI